jgi:SET domain-containing protein
MSETSAAAVAVDGTERLPLRVAELGSRGRGVVAAAPIGAGALIERAPVILVPEAERAAVDATNVGNYIFLWEHGTTGEDLWSGQGRAAIALGFVSLINHSERPNCRFIRHIEALALDLLALRDIEAGEELTFDYGMRLWFTPD